jgi:hypothetical protein
LSVLRNAKPFQPLTSAALVSATLKSATRSRTPDVLIEQAIFTSAESDHAVGYHLVARSPGLDEVDARELTVWGPSHNSLEPSSSSMAASVNFFRLPSGNYAVSKTQLAGEEYSGRGLRTYTNCLVVPPRVLSRFANNAFAILRAAWAKGLLKVCDSVPSQLVPFQLAGRAAPVDEGLIGQLVEQCGARTIGRLLAAVLEPKPIVLIGVRKPEATVAGLLNLLPLSCRSEVSFSTGLKYSQRRPFHLLIASEESAELRRLYRQQLVTVIDVSPAQQVAGAGAKRSPSDRVAGAGPHRVAGAGPKGSPGADESSAASSLTGWGAYVAEAIERDALPALIEQLLERQEGLRLANLNELGEHLRREAPAQRTPPRANDKKPNVGCTEDPSATRPVARQPAGGVETTEDDFLAMLLSGETAVTETSSETKDDAHAELQNGQATKSKRTRPAHLRQAPSVVLEVDSPYVVERLEKLDDVVFDAIGGDPRAMEEVARLWPQLVTELGPERVEESREQYLRYSLSIWESCLEEGLRDPERAVASLHVLTVLFSDK